MKPKATTVGGLIEKLEKFDKDLPVYVRSKDLHRSVSAVQGNVVQINEDGDELPIVELIMRYKKLK